MTQHNSISIIVPVYNAEEYLPIFLQKYSEQTLIDDNIELIFVDNGSTDRSSFIIKDYITKNKNYVIKYLFFDKIPDSYASRNYGVKNSNGEILVFTDSDCLPDPKWIENIQKHIKKGNVISGEVEIQVINEKNIWEVFDSFAHLNNKSNAEKGKVATANLAVTRSDFLNVGLFEERFSGGDHDWSKRAMANGLKVTFNEQIKVLHPSRKDYSQILQKSKRMAYGYGLNHRNKGKEIYLLVLLYFVKIFNVKTNVKYSKIFYKKNFSLLSIIYFNIKFFQMRIAQLIASIQGYRQINARVLNIK